MLWERESSTSCSISSPYSKVYSISTLFEPSTPRMCFSVKSYLKRFQLFYTLVTLGVLFNPNTALHIYIYAFSIFTRQGCLCKNVQVHFISAVCENMISGKGMHPGDIVTASNGITIEVYSSFLVLDICHCEILYSCYWVQHALSHFIFFRVWCWGNRIFQVHCLCCVHR
jgi:hypothetical protein